MAEIHDAVLQNDVERVKKLIQQGVSLNEPDERGNTPLHICAENTYRFHDAHVLELLLNAGVDTVIENEDGETAADSAYMRGIARVIREYNQPCNNTLQRIGKANSAITKVMIQENEGKLDKHQRAVYFDLSNSSGHSVAETLLAEIDSQFFDDDAEICNADNLVAFASAHGDVNCDAENDFVRQGDDSTVYALDTSTNPNRVVSYDSESGFHVVANRLEDFLASLTTDCLKRYSGAGLKQNRSTIGEEASPTAYLEYNDDASAKFWQIKVLGENHTVTYGRQGSNGTSKTKHFDSAEAAKKDAWRLIKSKLKKGYIDTSEETGVGGNNDEPLTADETAEREWWSTRIVKLEPNEVGVKCLMKVVDGTVHQGDHAYLEVAHARFLVSLDSIASVETSSGYTYGEDSAPRSRRNKYDMRWRCIEAVPTAEQLEQKKPKPFIRALTNQEQVEKATYYQHHPFELDLVGHYWTPDHLYAAVNIRSGTVVTHAVVVLEIEGRTLRARVERVYSRSSDVEMMCARMSEGSAALWLQIIDGTSEGQLTGIRALSSSELEEFLGS